MDVELTQFTYKSCWVTGNFNGYDFQAKHFDEKSQYGIQKGRTSKLSVSKDDELIIHYSRGWDIRPQTKEEKELLKNLVNYLEELPKRVEDQLSL